MTDRYIELHASSAFSFREGSFQPEALAERAYALNMPAMALMDRNGFYGSARFHKIATENKIIAHVGAEDFFGLKDDSVGSVHGDGLAAEEWEKEVEHSARVSRRMLSFLATRCRIYSSPRRCLGTWPQMRIVQSRDF